MQVHVPWSTGTVPVEIDEARVAGVLGANVERAADPEGSAPGRRSPRRARVSKAFLREAASPLLVVVNDATRPTPSAEVLRVHPRRSGGVAAQRRTATGSSPSSSPPAPIGWRCPQELEHIFGEEFLAAHAERIFSHDAKDKAQLVHLGRTSRGAPTSR